LDGFARTLRDAQARVADTRKALEAVGVHPAPASKSQVAWGSVTWHIRSDIHDALLSISEPLASKYAQVKLDVETTDRLSWSGSAHEIREVLRGLLEVLAPAESVTSEPWYVQDESTFGPTHKQRVRYTLRTRGVGTKEQQVAEQVDVIEDRIGNLVRATYTRASDAAHRTKDHREVRRIVRYFEAFAHDLLDLD
jgi:hypothetical protein